MATYYKYAERQEDAYVDWSAIGKEVSDSLLKEKKFREDTKAKIDEDTRQLGVKIDNAPQGQFQDGNKFTLQYASDAQQARLLQDKLLKSGQLSLKDYTVQRQNLNDGTSQIFDLAKLYQENYKTRMEGVNSGKLQDMNIANLASVEGFADFSKSQAVINAKDGTVSLASLEVDPVTGLKKVTDNIIPVSVLKGKILSEIPTFDVDGAMNKAKAALGTRVEAIYDAAKTSGAGTITQLTGIGAISKYPTKYSGIINDFNKALDNQVASWFSNPYNLSSVLTENLGKYNAESYTFDKQVAKSDPSKILLKINPSTQLSTLDESAPNYAAQKKEAESWVRSSLLAKLDSEVKYTPTAQTQETSASNREYTDKKSEEIRDVKIFAKEYGNALSGNAQQSELGVKALQGLGVPIHKTDKGFEIYDSRTGTTLQYQYGKNLPDEIGQAMLGAVNINNYPTDLLAKELSLVNKGRKLNVSTTVGLPSKPQTVATPKVDATLFKSSPNNVLATLQNDLPKEYFATKKESLGGMNGSVIRVYSINGGPSFDFPISDKMSEANAATNKGLFENWMKKEIQIANDRKRAKEKQSQSVTTTKGGNIR